MTALLLALLASILPHPMTTRATRYADTPRDEGGTPSCWRRCLRVGPGGSCARRFPDDVFNAEHPLRVAHRTLPCGTPVLVRSRADGRVALGFVLDRGPWGTRLGGSPRHLDRRAAPATPAGRSARPGAPPRPRYRGDLDLSPRVADALGLTQRVGRLAVDWWPLTYVAAP